MSDQHDDPDDTSRWRPLVGLLLVLVMVAGGWLLFQRMHENSNLEDCLMSGRRNCAPPIAQTAPR